jgi:hypothetical protein
LILGVRSQVAVFVVLVLVVLVLVVGNDDNLLEDDVQVVTSILLIASPLDEDVQAQRLDDLPGIVPRRLAQKLVVCGVVVSDVGQDGQLDSAREGNVGRKPDRWLAVKERVLRWRRVSGRLPYRSPYSPF